MLAFLFKYIYTHYSGSAGDVFALFNDNVRMDKGALCRSQFPSHLSIAGGTIVGLASNLPRFPDLLCTCGQ